MEQGSESNPRSWSSWVHRVGVATFLAAAVFSFVGPLMWHNQVTYYESAFRVMNSIQALLLSVCAAATLMVLTSGIAQKRGWHAVAIVIVSLGLVAVCDLFAATIFPPFAH